MIIGPGYLPFTLIKNIPVPVFSGAGYLPLPNGQYSYSGTTFIDVWNNKKIVLQPTRYSTHYSPGNASNVIDQYLFVGSDGIDNAIYVFDPLTGNFLNRVALHLGYGWSNAGENTFFKHNGVYYVVAQDSNNGYPAILSFTPYGTITSAALHEFIFSTNYTDIMAFPDGVGFWSSASPYMTNAAFQSYGNVPFYVKNLSWSGYSPPYYSMHTCWFTSMDGTFFVQNAAESLQTGIIPNYAVTGNTNLPTVFNSKGFGFGIATNPLYGSAGGQALVALGITNRTLWIACGAIQGRTGVDILAAQLDDIFIPHFSYNFSRGVPLAGKLGR